MTFGKFMRVAPIEQATIHRFADRVPAEVVDMWRTHGAGYVGDFYFRAVDPARAERMLDGVVGLPENSTVLFTTGLGDVVFHVNGTFLVIKFRYGVIDLAPVGTTFGDFAAMMERPGDRGPVFEWDPYPSVVATHREGTPDFEQCYGYVPLLALGGPEREENLRLCGLYEHIALIVGMAGVPQLRGFLPTAPHPPAPAPVPRERLTTEQARLADIGESHFRALAEQEGTPFTDRVNVIPFPEGVAVVRAVRGGGSIFVASDGSFLRRGSAGSFEDGLRAFRSGERTSAPGR